MTRERVAWSLERGNGIGLAEARLRDSDAAALRRHIAGTWSGVCQP